MQSRSLHVAVIGAGAAGLMAARELRREGHAPVVFERASGVGGNWLYDDAPVSGASADKLLGRGGVHSSLYASLKPISIGSQLLAHTYTHHKQVQSLAEGIDDWPGKQMHSHSYRVPDPFHGKVVVVVGYAPSGHDISRDIVGVAKEVHVACRSPAISEMQSTALPNLWLHPMIERAEEDGNVVFQDGCRVKAEAILHCTGLSNFHYFNCKATGWPESYQEGSSSRHRRK